MYLNEMNVDKICLIVTIGLQLFLLFELLLYIDAMNRRLIGLERFVGIMYQQFEENRLAVRIVQTFWNVNEMTELAREKDNMNFVQKWIHNTIC